MLFRSQLCSEARSGRVAGARLLCPGRALPRLASLLGFLPRKEQAARGWETPLAPSWTQLRSCLSFAPRPRHPWGGLRGRWLAHCQGLQQEELCAKEGKGKCRAHPAVAWPPRLSAARSAPGSQGPRLGSAAPHTRRLTPWVPSSCLSLVDSQALSFPAETCAAGWGLPLRALAPAHSPSSGQAAPEPRPAGGAERPHLEAE